MGVGEAGLPPLDLPCANLSRRFDRRALWRNLDSNISDAKELIPECLHSDVRKPLGCSQALMVLLEPVTVNHLLWYRAMAGRHLKGLSGRCKLSARLKYQEFDLNDQLV